MFALRYAYVVALAVWLGGMIVLGAIAAPSIFRVLQAADAVAGRAMAGAVFGEVLRRFHTLSYAAIAVLVLALAGMAIVGPRPHGFRPRLALAAVALAISLYSGVALARQIAGLQASTGGSPGALAPEDPRRVRFDRLHRLSTSLMMVNVAIALTLAYWEARE